MSEPPSQENLPAGIPPEDQAAERSLALERRSVERLLEQAAGYAADALSPATRAAYERDFRTFVAWAARHGARPCRRRHRWWPPSSPRRRAASSGL